VSPELRELLRDAALIMVALSIPLCALAAAVVVLAQVSDCRGDESPFDAEGSR
jgi:hypothetical protein